MKKVYLLLVLFCVFKVQSKTDMVTRAELERLYYYPKVSKDTGSSPRPSTAFCKLRKNLGEISYGGYSGSGTEYNQKKIDEIFKFYRFNLFQSYVKEIKNAYNYFLENESRVEIDKEFEAMKYNSEPFSFISYYMHIPDAIKYESYPDSINEEIVQKINNISTWEDFFLNQKKDDMLYVLKMLQIRECLNYHVEYELPKKMVPEYKKKLEIFLKEWGI